MPLLLLLMSTHHSDYLIILFTPSHAQSFINSMTDNDYMRLLRFDQSVGVLESGAC